MPAQAQDFINVLTGGTSGVYYPLGVALSKVFTDKVQGSRPSVQATKASVENLTLLQQGKGEIGFTLGDSLAMGWAGDEEAGFKGKLDKLRGITAIYPNYIQVVATQESGIKSLADLKGKRLSVGAPKSGTELNARAILQGAGLTYKDLGKVEYLPFGESVELMKNRQLDATLQSAGLGVSSIRDLATSVPIVVVEIPAAVVDKVGIALREGHDPRQHLWRPDRSRADGRCGELPRHPFRHEGRGRLPDDQGDLRQPARSRRSPCRSQGHQAGKRALRHACPDASGRAALFRREGREEAGLLNPSDHLQSGRGR